MSQSLIPFLRGDTLRIVAEARDGASGEVIDLTGYAIAAAVETDHGARVHDFAIPASAVAGQFVLSASYAETATWPEGPLWCAVRLTAPSGDRITSPAFGLSADRSLFDAGAGRAAGAATIPARIAGDLNLGASAAGRGGLQLVLTASTGVALTLGLPVFIATGGAGGGGGDKGDPGASAYEVAVAAGFVGTVEEWLASLEGSPGGKGDPGASAYEVAVAAGFAGTAEEWLASLTGSAGASAYQVAVADGFVGTVTQWLASLKGGKGDKGDPGQGVTVVTVATDAEFDAAIAAAPAYQITIKRQA